MKIGQRSEGVMKVKREVPPAGAFTKLRLLMWKNFLHQWRQPIKTIVEVVLPVGTMALVLILRSQIEPTTSDVSRFPPISAYSLNYSIPVMFNMNFQKLSVAYSPESPILEDVVRSAIVNLIRHNIDVILDLIDRLPGIPDLPPIPPDLILNSTEIFEVLRNLINVQAYNNSAALISIYREEEYTREVLAAVEFDDNLAGTTTLPDDLSYSLRFPEKPRLNSFYGTGGRSWRTNNVFPFFQMPGPRFPHSWEGGNDPGYVNEMFIALQHSISMELISRQTNLDLENFTVNIQRFPHPPYLQDLAVEFLTYIFPLFVIISFSYTSVNIVSAVTTEKENQLKEMMKIMGLPTWLHWTAWFLKQFIYMFLISGLLVLLLKVNWFTNEDGFSEYAVFTHTSWSVLLFFLTLYLTCMIFFGFMLSGFFKKASTASLFAGVIWFLTYLPAFLLSMETEVPIIVQTITCLSINSAMSYGFQLLLSQESIGGMNWGNFFSTHTLDADRLLFGHVVLLLCLDCVLYMLVALYLEQILPGTWGTPKPWYFIFQKSFWCPSATRVSDIRSNGVETDTIVRENEPRDNEIGVKMTTSR
ncbi:phospholipid-transporting ATPase ABCA3-like [Leptidea sinapis]|uniref:phospholipid-transporting ATPase ABCA3-like n=1 Tax=Leptidea sinapis TaxID=189913 RepID=UPI0021C4162E|nr:phospholipid-transporting ATPase ABCA3-like [Leptidea sinapis]